MISYNNYSLFSQLELPPGQGESRSIQAAVTEQHIPDSTGTTGLHFSWSGGWKVQG